MDVAADPEPDPAPREEADGTEPSLDELAAELAAAEQALERLEDGSYWTDEITGEELPDELLGSDPTARRVPPRPTEST